MISQISLGRKKIFSIVAYRSPNQTKDEFDIFYEKLQDTLDSVKDEKPHCIILMGDLNCRFKQWWPGDINSTEGMASDALLESNDLTQLIGQPTNIESTGVSCVDLIITDQPNLFVDYDGIHSSLFTNGPPCRETHQAHTNQSSDILQHSQNRPTGDRWLKF